MRIFRSYITVKGRRIYARQYGLKAFPILVDESLPNSSSLGDDSDE